jgi:hypothetical protein
MAHFDELVQRWKEEWQNSLKNERREIEKQGALTSVKGFEEFAKELTLPKNQKNMQDVLTAMEDLGDGNRKYAKMADLFKEVFNTNVLQIDHKEFSRLSSRLRIIYEGMLELGRERQAQGGLGASSQFETFPIKERGPEAHQTRRAEKNKGQLMAGDKLNDTQLKQATETVRRLYIMALSLRNIPNPLGKNHMVPIIEVNEAIKDFFQDTDQTQWEGIKKKHVDWINGKAEMEIQIASPNFNENVKAEGEKGIGRDLAAILRGTEVKYIKSLEKTDWGQLEGSFKVENELEKQAVQLAKGKKPKAKKAKTRKTVKGKTNPKKVSIKHTKKLKRQKKLVNIKPRGAVSRISKDVNEKQKTTAQIASYINRGLHKKLHQEMGRPALRYQSGTFARSVELKQLTLNKNNQLVGKYTYQLYPYQTFENTGRWPAGYNPKPLITKSIRELAERHTSQKIVNLRRV